MAVLLFLCVQREALAGCYCLAVFEAFLAFLSMGCLARSSTFSDGARSSFGLHLAVGRWLAVVFLCFGGTGALQIAAWSGMLVNNLQQESTVTAALTLTFNDEAPCELCRAIDRAESNPNALTIDRERLQLEIPAPPLFAVMPVNDLRAIQPWIVDQGHVNSFVLSVPVPPPRCA